MPLARTTSISIVFSADMRSLATHIYFHASCALLALTSSTWPTLPLPPFLIASHGSVKWLFVGLVTRHATTRSSPTRCLNKATKPNPADYGASRVLGHAVMSAL